jgi:hypothetical protein
MAQGLLDANLGGNLIKKRIGRPGQGKRGGLRTIVAMSLVGLYFFLYGFAKNERDDIDATEEAALKKLAASLLRSSSQALVRALDAGELSEVDCDA